MTEVFGVGVIGTVEGGSEVPGTGEGKTKAMGAEEESGAVKIEVTGTTEGGAELTGTEVIGTEDDDGTEVVES